MSSPKDASAPVEAWFSLVHSWHDVGIVRIMCIQGCRCVARALVRTVTHVACENRRVALPGVPASRVAASNSP